MWKKISMIPFLVLVLCACGVDNQSNQKSNEPPEQNITTNNDREVIAGLIQTTEKSPERERLAKEQLESDDYKNGMFGEPSPALAEEIAIQGIEAMVVIEAVEEIYGDASEFDREGVLFIENRSSGAKQTGVWIGIKKPDERLDKLLALLQEKVDQGEILAAPIHFYKSDYTQHELYSVQEDVANALEKISEKRGSFSVGADIMTGTIEVTHDFLTEQAQENLQNQFLDYDLNFVQDGRLIAKPGEETTTYPTKQFTTEPSKEGGYIMSLTENRMLVIAAESKDFSDTGGVDEFYEAIDYQYPNAEKQLKIGQRVHVEITGAIAESYPGQASAKYVEVLPEYKPENAKLSESEVVQKALVHYKAREIMAIRSITFDEETSTWKVEIKDGEKDEELEIKDQ